MKKATSLAAAALVVALLPACSNGQDGRIAEGDAPPPISAEKWFNTDGAPTLADLQKDNGVVLVEFWATWCPPCRQSIPHLNRIRQQYKDKGLTIVGLSNEPAETVKPFVEEMDMEYIVGAGSQSGQQYGVRGIPAAFLVKDNKIVWQGHPLDEKLTKELQAALEVKWEDPDVAEQVNGYEISRKEFYDQIRMMTGKEKPEEVEPAVKTQVLDMMINQAILRQALKARDVLPSDQEVQQAYQEEKSKFAEQQGRELEQYLNQQGIPEEAFKQQLALDVGRKKLAEKEFDQQALEKAFQEKPEAYHQYLLKQAVIQMPEDEAERKKAMERLEAVKKSVQDEDKALKEAAEARDVTVMEIGWLGGPQVTQELTRRGLDLKEGSISDVVAMGDMAALLYVEQKRDELAEVEDEVRRDLVENWVQDRVQSAKVEMNPSL